MTTNKQFAERLRKLADILQKDSRGNKVKVGSDHVHFNMGEFGSETQDVCGTTACAAGVAGLHPWFRRRGLKMVMVPRDDGAVGKFFLNGKMMPAMAAVSLFFGIWQLFDGCTRYGNTPKLVAKELREHAKEMEDEHACD